MMEEVKIMGELIKQNSQNIDLSSNNELNNSLITLDESNKELAELKIKMRELKDKISIHKDVVQYHMGDNDKMKCNDFYIRYNIRNYKATEEITKVIPAKEARQTKSLKIIKI